VNHRGLILWSVSRDPVTAGQVGQIERMIKEAFYPDFNEKHEMLCKRGRPASGSLRAWP
jgi:hypothetical protein